MGLRIVHNRFQKWPSGFVDDIRVQPAARQNVTFLYDPESVGHFTIGQSPGAPRLVLARGFCTPIRFQSLGARKAALSSIFPAPIETDALLSRNIQTTYK